MDRVKRIAAVVSFHLRLLPGAFHVLWDGWDKFITAATLLGVLFLQWRCSRPSGTAVLNWDLAPWWTWLPLGALLAYGLMKANYKRFADIERDKWLVTEYAEKLFGEHEALKRLYEESEPARNYYANAMRRLAAYKPVERARNLESKARKLVASLRNLAAIKPPGTPEPPRPATIRGLLALRGSEPWRTLSDSEKLEEFSREFVPQVYSVKSEFEAEGISVSDLDRCLSGERRLDSITRTAEILDAMLAKLQPLAWPNPGPFDS